MHIVYVTNLVLSLHVLQVLESLSDLLLRGAAHNGRGGQLAGSRGEAGNVLENQSKYCLGFDKRMNQRLQREHNKLHNQIT